MLEEQDQGHQYLYQTAELLKLLKLLEEQARITRRARHNYWRSKPELLEEQDKGLPCIDTKQLELVEEQAKIA